MTPVPNTRTQPSDTVGFPSRVRGALLGLATCDALGGPVEFKPRGTFPPVTTMEPNDNFGLPAGCFTDDTSMALCLAHSLVDCEGRSSAADQVRRYIRWWRDGYQSSVGRCFDIGVSTRSVLAMWEEGLRNYSDSGSINDEREEGSREDLDSNSNSNSFRALEAQITSRFSGETSCGNGSLMRVLPCALAARSEYEAVRLAALSSRPTQPHRRCVHACMLYSALVYRALNGATKAQLAATVYETVGETPSSNIIPDGPLEDELRSRLSRYRTLADWESTPETAIRSTGYVVDSLEAALWAFFTTDGFADAAVRAVSLGDDADTVGAICGGLAGAFYGDKTIPGEWVREMKRVDLLDEVVRKILQFRDQGA